MKNLTILLLVFLGSTSVLKANSEPSTYFNIYVPYVSQEEDETSALIVTAIYDNTIVNIIDDYQEGEEDNSYEGVLMAGQSYIHYMKDKAAKRFNSNNAHNKSNGDHFTITSNQLVYTSKSTKNDWQFNYVPAQIKSSVGQRFIVLASTEPGTESDLNVFAYDDNTTVSIKVISNTNTGNLEQSTVNLNEDSVLLQRTLRTGEDLIHFYRDGRNLMVGGNMYLIEASKPISVQHGALQNETENAGDYVPSSNGSLAGSLFYFTVPNTSTSNQELRVVSWEKRAKVTVERFTDGAWKTIGNYKLEELASIEFANQSSVNSTIYKVSVARGKKVSVFIGRQMAFAKGW